MIDVRAAIKEVQVRAEEDAYWHAMEKILGTLTARTLRGTLRVKIRGEGMTERERVARGLTELFATQAATVENLARQDAEVMEPQPRREALDSVTIPTHWVDFSNAANEARRAVPFIEQGLARGAKVVAMLPSQDVDKYRDEVTRSVSNAHGEAARFETVGIDDHLDTLRKAGTLAVVLFAIQGVIMGTRGQGYQELFLISKIAPALLAMSPAYSDLVLRLELALDALARGFHIAVYCPFPEILPGDLSAMADLIRGHHWAAVGDIALSMRTI